MSKKIEYTVLILFSLILLGVFLWQMQEKDLTFSDITQPVPPPVEEETFTCEQDSDCVLDEAVVLCPAEFRCENNQCVTYCVYDDVEAANMFQVSECLNEVDPLAVRENEYSLNWETDDLMIDFNIVLACSIQGLSGYYELADNNELSLYYEYKVPELTEPCLCVRTLTYRVPSLLQTFDYNININKIEK